VPGDVEISSTGLFLKEMSDHSGLSHTEHEITCGLFDEFSRCFVPDGSSVYAILRYRFREEYIASIDELRKSSFGFVTEREAAGKFGLRYRLLYWRIDARGDLCEGCQARRPVSLVSGIRVLEINLFHVFGLPGCH
jgi:hypothetical protein